jgi:hypothetical protein
VKFTPEVQAWYLATKDSFNNVYSPTPGSKLAGHRALSDEWYLDIVLQAADIISDAGVPAATENHCYRCNGNSLLHDALRLKGIE